jgi:hypothetical protein
MIGQLTGAGCYVAVVRSIDEARVTLMQYVELRDG